jgi:amino acid permease
MSPEPLEFPSRQALLSTGLAPGRRAGMLLFAIESRTAHLVVQSQQVTAWHYGPRAADERTRLFFEALAAGRDLPLRPTIQDLELYAPRWAPLVSGTDARLRAALARALGRKYTFAYEDVPAIRQALDLDEGVVQQAYLDLYHESLDTIFVPRAGPADRLRWAWNRLAKWLDALPSSWIVFILTLIIGGVTLALPIAAAGIGALPSMALILFFGVVNMVTIAAMAETVTRSGTIRFGNAFIGRMVADYLGNASSTLLSVVLTTFSFGILLVFYLGISTTLEGATRLPAEIWMGVLFAASLYFLSRGSLNSTVALTLVITAVNLGLFLALCLLALSHLELENLLYVNLPLLDGRPFDPSILGAIVGVILGTYSAHVMVVVFGKVTLQRDPGGRSLTRGHVAGIGFAMILNCLWVLAVNGAVPPDLLAGEPGTALVPLIDKVGPLVGVLGAIFVILSMGLGLIHFSIALFNLAGEWLGGQRGPGRFLASLSPVLAVFLVAEWLSLSNQGSYAGLLGLLGVIVDSLMGGIFPMLLLLAARRKGELLPETVARFLGHPLLAAGICLLYLFVLLFHGLVIWQNPVERAVGTLVGLLILGLILHLLRRDGLAPRLVVELRADERPEGGSLFAVTAGGQPLAVTVRLGYSQGEQSRQAAAGEIARFSDLRDVTFQLPDTGCRELKVWAHRITAEEYARGLPVRLVLDDGRRQAAVDLASPDGQWVGPLEGRACQLTLSLLS